MVSVSSVSALSMLYFDPVDDQMFNIGDTIIYDLYADIDAEDAIMGFGFDLSFDGGATFISAPSDSGSYLTFDRFVGNSDYFYYEPLFDDGGTISGWRTLFDPDVYGTGIRLGTCQFTAHALGVETILLSADDVGTVFSEEWLVLGATTLHFESILSNEPTVTASPVPEPATMLLLGTGLAVAWLLVERNSLKAIIQFLKDILNLEFLSFEIVCGLRAMKTG